MGPIWGPSAAPAPLPAGPSAPQDQRTASTYIFGAICPKDGKAAGRSAGKLSPDSFLIRFTLPRCNTQAMNLHLAEISGIVAPGRHSLLLPGQADWHLSHHLVVPENVTLLPLRPNALNLASLKTVPRTVF